MIEKLSDSQVTERKWTMRDDDGQHVHNWIPCEQSPITLTLNWKPDRLSTESEVGRYKIDLSKLLEAGFTRIVDGRYYLRFQRADSEFQVALNKTSPAHKIANHK